MRACERVEVYGVGVCELSCVYDMGVCVFVCVVWACGACMFVVCVLCPCMQESAEETAAREAPDTPERGCHWRPGGEGVEIVTSMALFLCSPGVLRWSFAMPGSSEWGSTTTDSVAGSRATVARRNISAKSSVSSIAFWAANASVRDADCALGAAALVQGSRSSDTQGSTSFSLSK